MIEALQQRGSRVFSVDPDLLRTTGSQAWKKGFLRNELRPFTYLLSFNFSLFLKKGGMIMYLLA